MNLTIKNIERIWVDVPYRPVPRRNMIRELPHWTIFELCLVTLECGVRGIGVRGAGRVQSIFQGYEALVSAGREVAIQLGQRAPINCRQVLLRQ